MYDIINEYKQKNTKSEEPNKQKWSTFLAGAEGPHRFTQWKQESEKDDHMAAFKKDQINSYYRYIYFDLYHPAVLHTQATVR